MKRRPQLITDHLLTVSNHQREAYDRRKLIMCVRPAFQRQLMWITTTNNNNNKQQNEMYYMYA